MKKLFVLLVLPSFMVSCNLKNITLADKSQTNYEIVIANTDDSLINHASHELQKYLEEISGVKIPLVTVNERNEEKNEIFVGSYPVNKGFNPHLIFYRVNGDNLLIGGGSAKSVLYSVYSFLENEMGCLWLSPGVEKIPHADKISVNADLDYEYTPDIETRTVHSKLFYDKHSFADKHKVTYEAFPGYVPEARVHTFHRFMPGSDFYEQHPEYYALREGKRVSTQLCLTNSEVLSIVTDSVAAYFKRHPGAGIISVSQDDNTLHCQCDNCASIDREEGSSSGTMIRFVNKIAEQFPGKTISTLAYQYTRKPCKTKPADNVLVTLCSIECDRSKPIEDGCTDFAADLEGWKQLSENIRIWDYTTQFTNFLAPFPNIHTLGPNIRFFRENNAKWVFEQHSHNPSELFELRSYLTAKLLWNPDLSTDEIISEFTDAYYEEAGSYIKEYIDIIHEEIKRVPDFFLFLYGDPSQAFDSFLRPGLLEKYDELFDKAEASVSDKADVLKRVQSASLSTHYAALEASRKGMSERYKLKKAVSRLEIFENICSDAGIITMNEMGYSVSEYTDSYRETIKRSEQPNIAAGKKVVAITAPKKYAAEDPMALTDGAFGGANFYSNWLGFEGNDMELIIDLGELKTINSVHTAFLQVTNHIVFFPEFVELSFPGSISKNDQSGSGGDDRIGHPRGDGIRLSTSRPLKPGSKVNDIEYFNFNVKPVDTRYIKIHARNMKKAPEWHNSAGLPSWIFCDEIIVN
ncbi:MAG: DUF4838 domain-containing protein [Bacteroidales bacterium]|nr:DUF4838 domain-containing protein [Bacteroidales bacterium]